MEIRFKLNPKNEKDKVIMEVLSNEYSPTETIKNLLYKMGRSGKWGMEVSDIGKDALLVLSAERESKTKNDEIDDDMASYFD